MLLSLLSVAVVSAGAGAVAKDSAESHRGEAEVGAVSDRATCDAAGGAFVALCEAWELISTEYVDPLDDQPLATGVPPASRTFPQ